MKLRRRDADPEARPSRPLSDVPTHEVVRVDSLAWDEPASARRLTELGLTPGAALVVLNRTRGAVIVAARGSRVAIGLDYARHVVVTAHGGPAA